MQALSRVEVPPEAFWRTCTTSACEVVWFEVAAQRSLTVADCRVRVHHKEQGEDRPVCYCFGYSVADVQAGVLPDGTNTVAAAIAERCRQGEHRCEVTNPQGRCCLGNVRRSGR